MTLSRTNWFYKAWAATYTLLDVEVPSAKSLCPMFWRTLLMWTLGLPYLGVVFCIGAPLILLLEWVCERWWARWLGCWLLGGLIAFLIVGGLAAEGSLFILKILCAVGAAAIILGAVCLVVLLCEQLARFWDWLRGRPCVRKSVILAMIKAMKDKVCPLVTIEPAVVKGLAVIGGDWDIQSMNNRLLSDDEVQEVLEKHREQHKGFQ